MPEARSAIFRFVAKLRGVFEEDWRGEAGSLWRRTIDALSEFNRQNLQLDDKAKEAPGLAWTAVEGLASEKHAKAAADYSKAENDRIDAALKRRVMEDKARQERATANKLESEAVQARIQELKARLSLAKDLQTLGIAIVIEPDGTIRASPAPKSERDILTALLNVPEMKLLDSALLDVRIPSLFEGVAEAKLTRWIKKRGDRVERDEPIMEIETHLVDSEIPSPAAGTLFEILVFEGTTVKVDDTVVARIDPDAQKT
jgi:pyruvate/2-oxoglutarate dehydrogenase complex dihydrolipoamide acyltransferase (E2) component